MKRYGLLLAVAIVLGGCTKQNQPPPPPPTPAGPGFGDAPTRPAGAPETSPTAGTQTGAGEWRVESADGALIVKAAPEGTGYSLYGPDDAAMGEITVEEDRVKVRDTSGEVLWKVKQKDDGCKLYDGKDVLIAEVKLVEGGFRLKDASDAEFARIKPAEGGAFKLYDAQDKESGKVKAREGGAELEDAAGTQKLQFAGAITPRAASFWGIERFDELQKAGLAAYHMKWE